MEQYYTSHITKTVVIVNGSYSFIPTDVYQWWGRLGRVRVNGEDRGEGAGRDIMYTGGEGNTRTRFRQEGEKGEFINIGLYPFAVLTSLFLTVSKFNITLFFHLICGEINQKCLRRCSTLLPFFAIKQK